MTRIVTIVIAVVAVLVTGGVAWSYLAPAEAPSAPIAAIPIELSPEEAATAARPAAPTEAPTETAAPRSAAAEPTTESTAGSAPTEAAAEPVLFEIRPTVSQARFVIDEVLNGAPKTVVGVTDQVAGQIAVAPGEPSSARLGTILINARGFATDSGNRNNAIRNRILRTNEYEFITFTPTGINDLPDVVAIGSPVTFQVAGDLTIMETTRPVIFEVTLTPASESELTGTAAATILYADWGIQIPRVPQVASVGDEVRLELEFTARPVS